MAMAAAGFAVDEGGRGRGSRAGILWRAWKRGGHFQETLLAVSVSLVVTTLLKQLLKWASGRYWPDTWKLDYPSLIGSGDYGFHPFHSGGAFEAFPSGHAAMFCAVLSVLWFSYPRWRWLDALIGAGVCVALVGMNYHFVGDVVAGVLLGSTTGAWMTHWFRLRPQGATPPRSDRREAA